jgi:hypothetical protein
MKLSGMSENEICLARDAYKQIISTHRKELKSAGWDGKTLFDGISLASEIKGIDTLPGVIALMMFGGHITGIYPDRVEMTADDVMTAKLKTGAMISGHALDNYFAELTEIKGKC